MSYKQALEQRVLQAARENGISAVLFRNATGRKLGLNVTDSECLSFLSIQGVATPKELAHYTGLTTGSTTAMLDRLEQAQFIRRQPNPKDRRGVLITIQSKYRETVGPYVTAIQAAQKALIASYSEAELSLIADYLQRFTANVKDSTLQIEQ